MKRVYFLCFVNGGEAVGAIAAHIDDFFGRCEPDVLPKARSLLEPFCGDLKVQEKPFAHADMEVSQGADF